jgi:hypothetical protein
VSDHHLDAASNVQFALGDYPVHEVGTRDELLTLLGETVDPTLILGARLSPRKELLALFGIGTRSFGALKGVHALLSENGWKVEESIAVLPTFDSARFCFPTADSASHRFLLQELLVPRRYSLPLLTQCLLHIYFGMLRLIPGIQLLYRGLYIRVTRS